MCCSCSTCACCTLFVACLLLATMLSAGYLIVKRNQLDKFVSRDFKKKFFALFNFMGTYGKVYVKKSLDKPKAVESERQHIHKQGYGQRVPVRVRPNHWANG